MKRYLIGNPEIGEWERKELRKSTTVSQEARALWDKLRIQISPFNAVITIDGAEFRPMNILDRDWICEQYL